MDLPTFRAAFPAFADAAAWPSAYVTSVITRSAPYFDVCRWGAFLNDGQGNWIAHELATNPPPESGTTAGTAQTDGDVTNKRVGSEGISRGESLLKEEMNNPYKTTKYGRKYLYLAGKVGVGAIVVQPVGGFGFIEGLGGPFA